MTRETLLRVLQRRKKSRQTKQPKPTIDNKKCDQDAHIKEKERKKGNQVAPIKTKIPGDRQSPKQNDGAAAGNKSTTSANKPPLIANLDQALFLVNEGPKVLLTIQQQREKELFKTRCQLAEATNSYNTALRMSNELNNHRDLLQNLLTSAITERCKSDNKTDKATTLRQASRENNLKQQIDRMEVELQASEGERKQTWWKMITTMNAFKEMCWQRSHGSEKKIPVHTDLFGKHAFPDLRSSLIICMPPPIPPSMNHPAAALQHSTSKTVAASFPEPADSKPESSFTSFPMQFGPAVQSGNAAVTLQQPLPSFNSTEEHTDKNTTYPKASEAAGQSAAVAVRGNTLPHSSKCLPVLKQPPI